jgi:hypothetical protein
VQRHPTADEREQINWAKMHDQGYVVLKGVASKYLVATVLDEIKREHPVVYDLSNGPAHQQPTGDEPRKGGRWQTSFQTQSPTCRDLRDNVMAQLARLLPGRAFSTLLAIGARKDCARQDPHTDFDVSTFEQDTVTLPLSAMIAVQKGTSIVVYKGSHKWVRDGTLLLREGIEIRQVAQEKASTMEIVHLERGDVMIWREIIHSGAEYATDNVRLFNYAFPTGYVEPRDDTGALVYHTYAIEFTPSSQPIPPPIRPTRTTRANNNHHPQIDMDKLNTEGHMLITDFSSMTSSQFECLARSLPRHSTSLFNSDAATIFNQTHKGVNDGLRRVTSLDLWLTATEQESDPPGLIRKLQLAVQRVIAALPEGYRHEVKPAEIYIIRSDAGCLQQAAHTDYDPNHADFRNINTAPLSFFFALSQGAKLVLWERPNTSPQLQSRTIELEQGQAVLLLGSRVHSGAAYETANFRGFMYIHQRTYVPPIPRLTYPPHAASLRRLQPTTSNLPTSGEPRAATDADSDSDGLTAYSSPQHDTSL